MSAMCVLAVSAVPPRLRGALTSWMIEPAAGLYVGTLSARVREEIWEITCALIGDGHAVMVHPDHEVEQRMQIRAVGSRARTLVEHDGLTLVSVRHQVEESGTVPIRTDDGLPKFMQDWF